MRVLASIILVLLISTNAMATVCKSNTRTIVDIYFSPRGGVTTAIVNEINNAKTEVLVQAYSFTSKPIVEALIAAKNRNISVKIILDKSQLTGKGSGFIPVRDAGILTYIDSNHAISHNKIIIIDGSTLITGSFNFTANAEKNNAENLLIIKNNKCILNQYKYNFSNHLPHAKLQ